MKAVKSRLPSMLVLILSWSIPVAAAAQGIALSGMGAVNQSMGGAATAAPLDAAGALHWNPATISGLASSEASVGLALSLPSSRLSSSISPGALGGGFPAIELAGADRSEAGVSPIPHIALVKKSEDSSWTFGLGVFAIGGFRVNYPASATNPILTPQPPNGLGVGRLFAEAEFLQIAPTVSYALSDQLSIGIAPTLTMGRLTVDPLLSAPPDDANGDNIFSYPSGRGNRWNWGGGFQVGIYYITEVGWHFGGAVKSPQWFEEIRFKTENELGGPRTATLTVEYPLIVTVGAAYCGFEHIIIAVDARYFDYGNAEGLSESGFDSAGALRGLGWRSIFATAVGIQRRVNECVYIRGGYSYNQNPISDENSGFNIASPVITQHFIYLGCSRQISPNVILSITYAHAFQNEVSGPIQLPHGPLPGTQVSSAVSLDALSAAITLHF